jgi:hypothetical protein
LDRISAPTSLKELVSRFGSFKSVSKFLRRKLSEVSAKSDTFPICMQFQKQKTYQQSCPKVGETYIYLKSAAFSVAPMKQQAMLDLCDSRCHRSVT